MTMPAERHEKNAELAREIYLRSIESRVDRANLQDIEEDWAIEDARIAYRMADIFNRVMHEQETHYDEIYGDE